MTVSEDLKSEAFSLKDHSAAFRVGFRGRAVKSLLIEAGITSPSEILTACKSAHTLVVSLPHNEFWLLSMDSSSKALPFKPQTDCYDVFCQDTHAWFELRTDAKVSLLSKLCAVDLSINAFPNGAVIHTFVAGCKTLVVHYDGAFHLLCDQTVSHGLWAALTDASAEYLS
jgi:sarcosine oxidase subunit gamma